MADQKDGGPAFPLSSVLMEQGEVTLHYQHPGMTLRDYFAGQAMAGGVDPSRVYAWADVALAERSREPTVETPAVPDGATVWRREGR